jgi:virginiamycin B lyase
MPGALAIALLVCAAALAVPAGAGASITAFPLPHAGSGAAGITLGPDGALWFTEVGSGLGAGSGQIGRITTSGTVTEFPIPSPGSIPWRITTGPDGALWFTEQLNKIGRITTSGSVQEFTVPGGEHRPIGIASGPDGALWFTNALNSIGRVTTGGTFSEFAIPTTCCGPSGITAGPDGALWFTEIEPDFHGEIVRIATNGTMTRFPIPTTPSEPSGITLGPDGALWFTDAGANSIGRVTTTGSFRSFPIRTPDSTPREIVTGPDGALWFTEEVGKIGRMTTDGAVSDFRLDGPAGDIASGPDGALWFTGGGADQIGRITPDQPLEDSVDGTLYTEAPCVPFEIGCTKPRYVFGVSSTASGERAFGHVSYIVGERAGVFENPAAVTCLAVHGNRATIGANFADPLPGPSGSRNALIFLEDNGPAGQDRFAVQPLSASTAPPTCPANPPSGVQLGPGFPGAGGGPDPGVVITDAQPFPASKADCRHGGYRRFGFRNQGQCIAFVVKRAARACLPELKRDGWLAFARCIRKATGP